MARLSEATGRPVIYNNLGQSVRRPGDWQRHMARVSETAAQGIRAYPLCSPNTTTQTFNMANTRGVPRRADLAPDPALLGRREAARLCLPGGAGQSCTKRWSSGRSNPREHDLARLVQLHLGRRAGSRKEQLDEGQDPAHLAQAQNKGSSTRFLDLVVEEKLQTVFMQAENNIDLDAMRKILNFPNALIGLSDGGAHVQFHGGYGFSTRLLGEWVREKQVMSVEKAVRRLTFDLASTFGLYDRGLLRPGMSADVTIFDPDTVKPLPEFIVHHFPAGGWR